MKSSDILACTTEILCVICLGIFLIWIFQIFHSAMLRTKIESIKVPWKDWPIKQNHEMLDKILMTWRKLFQFVLALVSQ